MLRIILTYQECVVRKVKPSQWIPEIMYEEDVAGVSHSLPFILVPTDEEMPKFLLIWENRNTGEVEPGPSGEEIPIVDATLRQYAMMDTLKENLSAEDYDKVRVALGLEPMKTAAAKGRQITQNVADKVKTQSKSDDN